MPRKRVSEVAAGASYTGGASSDKESTTRRRGKRVLPDPDEPTDSRKSRRLMPNSEGRPSTMAETSAQTAVDEKNLPPSDVARDLKDVPEDIDETTEPPKTPLAGNVSPSDPKVAETEPTDATLSETVDSTGVRLYICRELVENWVKFCEFVSEVSGKLMAQTRAWDELSPETREELSHWTPQAKDYLEDKKRANLIVMARIWHSLDLHLFSLDLPKRWTEGPWNLFARLQSSLKHKFDQPWVRSDYDATFLSWRQLSVRMLAQAAGEAPSELERLTESLKRDLLELGSISKAKEESLREIARKALSAHQGMTATQSKFWISWQGAPPASPPPGNGADGKAKDGGARGCLDLWGFTASTTPDGRYSCTELGDKSTPRLMNVVSDADRRNYFLDEDQLERLNPDADGKPVELVVCPGLFMDTMETMRVPYYCVHPIEIIVATGPHQHGQEDGQA